MKNPKKLSSQEKTLLIELAYSILKKGYHPDTKIRIKGEKLETTPYTISIVYEELVKFLYK